MTIVDFAPSWPFESTRTQPVIEKEVFPFKPQDATDRNLDPQLLIDLKEFIDTIDRIARPTNEQYRHWPTALRILTAWLEDMKFAEVSVVVGIEVNDLRDILHGKVRLNRSKYSRIDRVLEITRLLRTIIDEKDIDRWYRTSDPALNGLSPIEALKKQKIAEVERVVESYFDPSYA